MNVREFLRRISLLPGDVNAHAGMTLPAAAVCRFSDGMFSLNS